MSTLVMLIALLFTIDVFVGVAVEANPLHAPPFPTSCPSLQCTAVCPSGHRYQRDHRGCQVCQCIPCRSPMCPPGCLFGTRYASDPDGCRACICTDPLPGCPMFQCPNSCPLGRLNDANGCPTCHCRCASVLPTCPSGCPFGTEYSPDNFGCPICECKNSLKECPHLECENQCAFGRQTDADGCKICTCKI